MDTKKILIVDDEKDALSILEKELTTQGYSIIVADNGNDALNLAKSEHPDLVILDIWMPDMDGSEVAARLKENPTTKDIPLIFLTCLFRKKEEAEQGNVIASNVLIAKPYSITDLAMQIRELLTEADHLQLKS